MKFINKTVFLIILSFFIGHSVNAKVNQPDINGGYGVAIDAQTNEILYDKNANKKAYPASITKVMTAILLMENVEKGEMIKTSKFASIQEGSNSVFRLKEGEGVSREDALKALMVMSANDMAVAIAEHISGSEEEFGKLMTSKAEEIGTSNTVFKTASGLHHPEHQTTPYDMALITKESMEYPEILEAMATQSTTIKTDTRDVSVTAKNKIDEYNPLALGGKTGYTSDAGNTLVEILQQGEKKLVVVVMKTNLTKAENGVPNEYNDINIMANHAFNSLVTEKIVTKGEVYAEEEVHGQLVSLVPTKNFSLSVKQGEKIDYETQIDISEEKTNFEQGDIVGSLKVIEAGEVVEEIPLVTNQEVIYKSSFALGDDENSSLSPLKVIFIGIGISIVVYLMLIIYMNIRHHNKLKNNPS